MGARDPDRNALESAPSLSRRLRLAMVGLVLARGLVDLCTIPPFEGWDEYQHVAYVVHVAETGRPAVVGKDDVPDSLLRAMIPAFPQPRLALEQLDSRLGALDYASFWSRPAADPSGPRTADAAGVRIPLYQAQHSWWYYAMVAPLFEALGGVHDLRTSVAGLRLVNVLLIAASAWVVLGVIARRVRSRRLAWWAGAAIAAQPLFLLDGARVSSDAPGVFLATVVVAVAMVVHDRAMIRRFAAMGLLAGLAVLAKATGASLVPLVAGSWLYVVIRHRTPARRALASGVASAVGFSILVGPEVLHNLSTYGVPTSMQEAILNHQHGRGAGDLLRVAADFPWPGWLRWLWLRGAYLTGGWSYLEPSARLSRTYYLAVVGGVLGWGWRLATVARRRGRPGAEGSAPAFDSAWTPMACLLICAGATATLGYHALQSKLAWGEGTTQPWYAASAFPWFQVLVVGGALAWPGRLGPMMAAVLVGSYVVGEQAMIWTSMLPTYSGGAAGWAALGRIAQLQPPALGTATLLAAQGLAGGLAIAIVLAGTIGRRSRSGPSPVPPAPMGRPSRAIVAGHAPADRGF